MGTLVFQATLGGSVNLIGPNTASTINFTLPSADGTNGQALTTNGSGTLAFSTVTTGAAGSTTQVQYNSSGAFAGSANMTFDGTSLTLGGNPTLSAGTANGVTYLNGSKVLTSGSALTFDGTLLSAISASASTTGLFKNTSTTAQIANLVCQNDASTALNFGVFGSAAGSVGAVTAGTPFVTTSATNLVIGNANASGVIQFTAGGLTEQMRLTSTGLGIGTSSPVEKIHASAASGYTALRLTNTGSASPDKYITVFQGSSSTGLSDFNETGVVEATSTGGLYLGAYNGPIRFYTGSIARTERMRLDSAGLLQVGATSPINSGAVTFASTGGTYNQLELCDTRAYSSTPNSSLGFAVKYNSAGSYTNMAAIVGTKENATDGNYSGALLFYTSLNGSGSAERARILSSGEFLVSTTTSFGVGVTIFTPDSGGSYSNATSTAARNHWRFANSNGAVGSIQTSGSATSYNTSSDYRLKNTIAPMTGALAKVAQLKPVTYKWNADGSDGEGFIAHELAEVVPQCVTGEKDAVDEEGNPVYQGIDTSFLVATLTAAIQEQQAIIESLKARLDAANL